ncbi:hypothetical protein AWH62_08180 [Maricaulis sp. W15]|uniref:hypothetical protein n=1 Tax=Maricaulis sp. W15 TaxID=1772333 RepID=UPI000948EA46|nr:hypothetical protein [Maricaulis sp. W15]OLF74105.1 hypothetical protein AWH62_08180 [Maricaulis sp. W15]
MIQAGIVGLAAFLFADEVVLPATVTDAYFAYEAAVEQQDFAAASQAAEIAFREARAAGIGEDIQLTLGVNALAMAPARGSGAGLVELVDQTADLAIRSGDTTLVRDVRLQGISSAAQAGDAVGFGAMMAAMIDALIEPPLLEEPDQARLFAATYPNSFTEPLGEDVRTSVAAERDALLSPGSDPVQLANLTLILRRDAFLRDDRGTALDLTDEALALIDADTMAGARAQTALLGGLPGLADILVADGLTVGQAVAERSSQMQDALCAHLSSQPVPVGPWREVQVPTRSVERGRHHAAARFEFEVVDGEFASFGPEMAISGGRDSDLRRAVERQLSETVFHAGCDGEPASMRGLFRVTYVGGVTGHTVGAYQLSFRLLQSISPARPVPAGR